jgi:hypothetical protein
MTLDDEKLIAFADGELGAIEAKRVERAIAGDPEMTRRVAAHRNLREQLSIAYPIVSGPDPLAAMIAAHNVVAMPARPARARSRVIEIAALAACLIAGVAVGTQWQNGLWHNGVGQGGPVASRGGALIASGTLAAALDTKLASAAGDGDTKILVSFRDRFGSYCRVFAGQSLDGIACKQGGDWRLLRTQASDGRPGGNADRAAYRQAGSANGALMAEAQNLMTGEPLDGPAEQNARASGWVGW